LSTAPTAVKAAASCYIDLIVKESDNNVKLIVLDRLIAMKVKHVDLHFVDKNLHFYQIVG
jgi:hypothetical protein